MKALVYLGPRDVAVRDVPDPEAKKGQVMLRVKYCGICGADTLIHSGRHPRAKAPMIIGHEFLGEVMNDGKFFHVGDLVAPYPILTCGACLPCRTGNSHVCKNLVLIGVDKDGGAAQYICVDEGSLYKVPDGVSAKAAALIEPLAVVVRAIHQSGLKALDATMITGAGPIGLLTGIMLMHMGASKVLISDVNKNRLRRAEALGMTAVDARADVEAFVNEATGGEGVDILYECSGADPAVLQMPDLVRVNGSICMISHAGTHPVNFKAFGYKEQKIAGTRMYTRDEFRQAAEYTARIQKELGMAVSHVLPLEDSPGLFDMIACPDNDTAKILIDCSAIGETRFRWP